MMSSWRQEFPAATAFAVAIVIPLVMRMNSSGVVVVAGGSELLNTCEVNWQGTLCEKLFFIQQKNFYCPRILNKALFLEGAEYTGKSIKE